MNLKKARKTAISLVHAIDPDIEVVIPLKGKNKKRDVRYTFDGKRIITSGNGFAQGFHDVVHFLVAAPKRRKIVEFGLGFDPYRYSDADKFKAVNSFRADDEEGFVCDLQIGLLIAMNISTRTVRRIADELFSGMPTSQDIKAVRKYRPSALSAAWWKKVIKACEKYDD